MTFSESLISLRKQRGLSQEQLGAEIGVTRQTVSKWELGGTTPEMDKLIQLSEFFDISIGALAVGGFALGIFALGGCAIGMYSIGGCAIASKIAAGGYAHAPIAIGDRVNGEILFSTKEQIAPGAIKNAILERFPRTWEMVVGLFESFLS